LGSKCLDTGVITDTVVVCVKVVAAPTAERPKNAALGKHVAKDCNPGLEFSIPVFGIVEFQIPGSRWDWRSIVKTTKIAKWVTVFGSFLN